MGNLLFGSFQGSRLFFWGFWASWLFEAPFGAVGNLAPQAPLLGTSAGGRDSVAQWHPFALEGVSEVSLQGSFKGDIGPYKGYIRLYCEYFGLWEYIPFKGALMVPRFPTADDRNPASRCINMYIYIYICMFVYSFMCICTT